MSRVGWAAIGVLVSVMVAQALGLRLLVVAGNSMSPSIRDGDLVVTSRLALGSSGEVVLVQRPSDGQLLLHRVIERGRGWRRTQGDASLSPDAEQITDARMLGGLVAVIPTGLLGHLPIDSVAAQFSAGRRLDLGISATSGARAELSGPILVGADALGKLLPGARATWTLTLTPCPVGVGGECAGAMNTLRIDPDRFTSIASTGIARSLRLTTACRVVGTTPWIETSDLFTSAWILATPATGRLTSLAVGSNAQECQVQIILLGSIAASNSALTLPLRWGPE